MAYFYRGEQIIFYIFAWMFKTVLAKIKHILKDIIYKK